MKKITSIILILLTIFAMITNFIFAVIFRGESGANIFTTVSGWISGIATIVLGVIALYVNAQYKKENDDYLIKQDELAWKNEKRSTIELYRDQVMQCYNNFTKYNYTDVLYQILSQYERPEAPIYDIAIINKIHAEKHNMFFSLTICKYYFSQKSELFNTYSRYLNLLYEMIQNNDDIVNSKQYEKFEELQKTYVDVINLFNIHISDINVFLSTTIFSKDRNDLELLLNDMRKKQLAWWEKVKPEICNSNSI